MTTAHSASAPCPQARSLDLQAIEQAVATSRTFAWCIVVGLPAMGIVAVLTVGLPLFVALMGGCFLLATGLVCHRAIATFTGKTLRLLVTARLVIVLVLGALLLAATGTMWTALVSTVLCWLVADRLLGRRALRDLYRLVRPGH